ncbi:MAG TPA: IPTL-CTERM sorting domain-containing protein [Candidatus Polarisedimenticolaceae bacterium]|nr:IPTL-CTERM sorting domain-containing protein [Candidatus Polarisedimenticolaceae bacterium]
MNRMTNVFSLGLVACLGVVVATPVRAQNTPYASEHYFNGASGFNVEPAGGNVELTAKIKSCPGPGNDFFSFTKVYPAANPGIPGPTVATDMGTGLCLAITPLAGVVCTVPTPGGSCSCDCGVDAFGTADFSITVLGNGVTVAPEGVPLVDRVKGLDCKTTGANNGHGSDLLQKFLVRVTPGGSGNLEFTVGGTTPKAGTNPFVIDTTGKGDLQLHNEICVAYAALGLNYILHTNADRGSIAVKPSNFDGAFVELTYPVTPPTVTQFDVKRLAGASNQTITTETLSPDAPTVVTPALSGWAMMVLVVLLVAAGIWMLRRRQKLQSA